MGVTIRGMRELIDDLEAVDERAAEQFPKVLFKGAMNVKEDWQTLWRAIRHMPTSLPHLVRGIGFDTDNKPPRWSAEIGVDARNSQAPLGHIIEYGSVNNRPYPGGQPALDAEEPRFVKAIADVAEEILGG